MQTNLHRVSEFAVTAKQKDDDGEVKADIRAAIKRLRGPDSDTESEVDDIVGSSNISTTLPDLSSQGGVASDPGEDSSKSDIVEPDTTVYLSLDWEKEEPYEKAVERYYFSFFLVLVFLHTPFGIFGGGCGLWVLLLFYPRFVYEFSCFISYIIE